MKEVKERESEWKEERERLRTQKSSKENAKIFL